MQDHGIYALTPLGEKELRGSVTMLSPAQLDLLVRIDGVLTFAQIKAGMPEVSLPAFKANFDSLLFRHLLAEAQTDPFADQFRIQINKMASSRAEAEADSASASLKKAGYYVRIARQRGAGRRLAPGEMLSAIVVDDEPMLAKFIQSYLSLEGFHVRLAGNRAEVIAEFRKPQIPDLILLDVMLPDADGFDILLRLRQHAALKNVPVIMLTGKATREAVIKGLACGADGYITKPFEAEALMQAVRTVVGLPEDPTATTSKNLWIKTKSKF